jgi:hypothetical protein
MIDVGCILFWTSVLALCKNNEMSELTYYMRSSELEAWILVTNLQQLGCYDHNRCSSISNLPIL